MVRNYTVDDLNTFDHVLKVETILNICVNGPVIWLILKHSTKIMGYYKYYLLYTVIMAMITELHHNIIFGLFMILPVMGVCCAGLCRCWSNQWAVQGNFLILHVNVSGLAFAILAGFLYRYFALIGKLNFFKSKNAFIIFFISGTLYPLPAMIVQYYLSLGRSIEHTRQQLERNAPQFLSLLEITTCSSLDDNEYSYLYSVIASFQVLFYTLIVGIIIMKTVRLIKTLELTSLNTHYAAEKRLFVALCLQFAIPLFVFILPTITTFILSFLQMENITVFSEFTMIRFSLHGTLNGLLVIMTIQPYRKTLIRIFSKSEETKITLQSLKWISSK